MQGNAMIVLDKAVRDARPVAVAQAFRLPDLTRPPMTPSCWLRDVPGTAFICGTGPAGEAFM